MFIVFRDKGIIRQGENLGYRIDTKNSILTVTYSVKVSESETVTVSEKDIMQFKSQL